MRECVLADLLSAINGKLIAGYASCQIKSFSLHDDPPAREGLHILDRRPYTNEQAMMIHLTSQGVHALLVSSPHGITPEKWAQAGIAVAEVENIVVALYKLALFHRSQYDLPMVQVVGSSGKTTTKEMLASVLRRRFPMLATTGSLNSPEEVARTLLHLTDRHKAAVIETGMLQSGVIAKSAELVRPTYGVVTTVHRAHLVRMGSLERIIAAKAELLPHISVHGALLINWDNEHCRRFPLHECDCRIVRFGFSEECDLQASKVRYENFRTVFTVCKDHHEFEVTLNTFGSYNAANALAAAGIGLEVGLSPEEIASGLASFRPVPGRLEIMAGQRSVTVINDHFNANPDSTGQLLTALPEIVQGRPLVLVLGDMERPDDQSAAYARAVHREIGERAAAMGPCRLVSVGKWAVEYVRGALAKGFPPAEAFYYPSVEAAVAQFGSLVSPGSIVVFKASVYTPISQLITCLLEAGSDSWNAARPIGRTGGDTGERFENTVHHQRYEPIRGTEHSLSGGSARQASPLDSVAHTGSHC